MTPSQKVRTIKTWAQAKKLTIKRTDLFGQKCRLESGVNFFILMLEKLGAITMWSCEGHPTGFYIVFAAPLELAHEIFCCGYFRVELAGGYVEVGKKKWPRWSMRLNNTENEEDRVRVLKWAAMSWYRHFGEIQTIGGLVANKKKAKA
jgi:hypothetical protein